MTNCQLVTIISYRITSLIALGMKAEVYYIYNILCTVVLQIYLNYGARP